MKIAFVIANGASQSAAIAIPPDVVPIKVRTPAALTANSLRLIFHESEITGGTYRPVLDEAGNVEEVVTVVDAAQTIKLELPETLKGCPFLKVTTTQADGSTVVAQGAERSFEFICRPVA